MTAETARPPTRLAGGVLGLVSAGVALGAAQLAAGVVGGASSPMIAVGSAAIDATPEWLKSFAIRTFGTNDKLALLVGIAVVMAIAAVALGVASLRRSRAGVIGIGVFAAIGVAASVSRPANGLGDAIPSLVGAAAGAYAFRLLGRRAGIRDPFETQEATPPAPVYDRRRFLKAGFLMTAFAGVSGVVGQYLVRRADASASRAAVHLPIPVDAAPPPPPGADLGIPGVGPFITPNADFYRIDTALFVPSVSAESWELTIHGMVDRPVTLDYRRLLERPMIERDVTLTCVSNQVGGRYIGNARWMGAPLKALLEEAGVKPGATQIVTRSVDGFTIGTPTAAAMDGRDAMLAVAMNGEALPLEHGFPVRMIVPGLYGYVSAMKWLVDMELTTFEAYDAYWIQRGWAQRAPVKTESRIDTPRSGAKLRTGQVAVAGVAWAQHRGIEKVEVQIDDDPWQEADLAEEDTIDTWRQWVYRWDAPRGDHLVRVRATDGTDTLQVEQPAPPFPSGATGDHAIDVHIA